MNNCIFIGMMFNQLVLLMMVKQVKMSYLEQQIVIGCCLVIVKDDLVVFGVVVGLDCILVFLECMQFNVGNVQNCLGLQENVLVQVGDMMGCIIELIIYVNNLVLVVLDKQLMVIEIEVIWGNLFVFVNSIDGIGCYLFGGMVDGSFFFSQIDGKVVYNGDQNQC